jgi:hypothetical protein
MPALVGWWEVRSLRRLYSELGRTAMRIGSRNIAVSVAGGVILTTLFVYSLFSSNAQNQPANEQTTNVQTSHRYLPEYTASGDLILPKNWREWVFVGAPFTPNALNGGQAGFPEFHNVYIEPGSYEIYKKTNEFPEGTIFFKELQLTLPPAEFPDGSRTEPSGRGYFPGQFNGADVSVKDTKRYAATGGGATIISITMSQKRQLPKLERRRNARTVILQAPRKTMFSRNSIGCWTLKECPRLSNATNAASSRWRTKL